MDKTAIFYWSGTGNTEAMANAFKAGLEEKGLAVDLFNVESADVSVASNYDKIVFGCPSMGSEVLEEDTFEPFFETVEKGLSGKKVALFGSYGWGDGEWMRSWTDRTKNSGANLYGEGLIMQETPDEADCTEYARNFADY